MNLPCGNKPLKTSECSNCDDKIATLEENVAEIKDKLKTIEEGAEVNVQADWTEENPDSDSYIQNKPDLADMGIRLDGVQAIVGEAIVGEAVLGEEVDLVLEKLDGTEDSIEIEGAGAVSVSQSNDVLTIDVPIGTQAQLEAGTDTEGKAWDAESLHNYISSSDKPKNIVDGDNYSVRQINAETDGTDSAAFNRGHAYDLCDFAEGSGVASGRYSHAEGINTQASGSCSHTEGLSTEANNSNAHAEGNETKAYGYASHAEGNSTTASGDGAHAEGGGTIAGSDYQHVFGQYNVADSSGQYVEIVGKGSSSLRSDARNLKWNGAEWLADTLTVSRDPSANMEVATKQYVDNNISSFTNFLGVTTTALTDGATTNPITIGGASVTANKGDIVTYGSTEFIFNGTLWQAFGDLSALGALAYKDSASGTVTVPNTFTTTITPQAKTVSVSGTPDGSVSVTPSTTTKYVASSASGGGSATAGTAASCTLPVLTTTVTGEKLSIGWSAGSFTANTPTAVTMPTFSSQTIATGISSASFTGSTMTSTGSYTPATPTASTTIASTENKTITVS